LPCPHLFSVNPSTIIGSISNAAGELVAAPLHALHVVLRASPACAAHARASAAASSALQRLIVRVSSVTPAESLHAMAALLALVADSEEADDRREGSGSGGGIGGFNGNGNGSGEYRHLERHLLNATNIGQTLHLVLGLITQPYASAAIAARIARDAAALLAQIVRTSSFRALGADDLVTASLPSVPSTAASASVNLSPFTALLRARIVSALAASNEPLRADEDDFLRHLLRMSRVLLDAAPTTALVLSHVLANGNESFESAWSWIGLADEKKWATTSSASSSSSSSSITSPTSSSSSSSASTLLAGIASLVISHRSRASAAVAHDAAALIARVECAARSFDSAASSAAVASVPRTHVHSRLCHALNAHGVWLSVRCHSCSSHPCVIGRLDSAPHLIESTS
jgi:hypothetical protein